MSDWKVTLESLATGIVAGAIFTYIGLPIPAPGVLAGVVGIIGIYAGYKAIDLLRKRKKPSIPRGRR